MGNCLVTKLKETVDNTNLKKLNSFRINYADTANQYIAFQVKDASAGSPLRIYVVAGKVSYDNVIYNAGDTFNIVETNTENIHRVYEVEGETRRAIIELLDKPKIYVIRNTSYFIFDYHDLVGCYYLYDFRFKGYSGSMTDYLTVEKYVRIMYYNMLKITTRYWDKTSYNKGYPLVLGMSASTPFTFNGVNLYNTTVALAFTIGENPVTGNIYEIIPGVVEIYENDVRVPKNKLGEYDPVTDTFTYV